jgi:hypothetical protein
MANVIRVSRGDRWLHVPDNEDNRDILSRMLVAGLAANDGAGIKLLSEAGPIFWDSMKPRIPQPAPVPRHVFDAMRDGGIVLLSGEMLSFGRQAEASYNDYADMSWLNNPSLSGGLPISLADMNDEDIVLTAWPGRRRLVPAKVMRNARQASLEMACPAPRGERCFVLEEFGTGLLTASMASSGDETLKIMRPASFVSWLMSIGSKAMSRLSSRFSLKSSGDGFVIDDSRAGRRYSGKFVTTNPADEASHMEWILARHGLGGILKQYMLERA